MSANIETMAYRKTNARDIPWHGLGVAIEKDFIDGEEMCRVAGLDWTTSLRPVFAGDGDFGIIPANDYRANVRDTDDMVLGVVGKRFVPLQNTAAFAIMNGKLNYETAGSLEDGRRVWALAQLGEEYRVGNVDRIVNYILVLNGHDGNTPITIKPCNTRVVCANTVAAALRERTFSSLKIRHTVSAEARIKDADRQLNIMTKINAEMMHQFDLLAQANTSDELNTEAFNLVVPPVADDATEAQRQRAMKERLAIWKLYQSSDTVDRGTRWGTYNAVTEFLDHKQSRRGQDYDSANADHAERRALYSLEGAGADIRNNVFRSLLKDLVPA